LSGAADLVVEFEQLLKGAENYRWLRPRGAACGTGVMMNAFLGYGKPFSGGTGKDFGGDKGTCANKLKLPEDFSFKKFEGTIDVADFKTKKETDELCPAEAVEAAKEIILAVDAKTINDVKLIGKRE